MNNYVVKADIFLLYSLVLLFVYFSSFPHSTLAVTCSGGRPKSVSDENTAGSQQLYDEDKFQKINNERILVSNLNDYTPTGANSGRSGQTELSPPPPPSKRRHV
ncbi:cyclophilin-like peptidyl-prolyl cis-transisomerase family protein [Striga asiatica]|uniref:Cyclophilin-like peptidyl-prolyl cis-transisomerase family protein n=1 Tax=Striga asiatica TaxID=4170 RepID=A0A5A7PZV5_STRAF|nr:cyclophilin-like peptidyl-prolyl cis-transisomerase family protein [Striga asiatica]